MSGVWTARVRDSNLALGEPVEISQLTLVENFNAADSLALDGDLRRIQPALVVGSGIIVYDSTGAQRFSGDLQHPERVGDGTGSAIYRSDTGLFWDYILWPVPSASWDTGQTVAYDTITGSAEARLLHYITGNMGSTAYNSGSIDRRVPHLRTPTSLDRGPSGVNNGRFHPLSQVVMGLAEVAGLRLEIRQTFSGLTPYLDVKLTVVPDMSTYIRFGTAEASGPALLGEGSRYSLDRPAATMVLSAAQGTGAARNLKSSQDLSRKTLWNRHIEFFVDQRDNSDATEITQGLDQAMLDGAGATEVAIEVASTPDFVIGSADCPLGAQVTAVIDTLILVNRIRQITTVVSADGGGPTENISAVFGSPDALLTVTQRQIADNNRRLNVIERAP